MKTTLTRSTLTFKAFVLVGHSNWGKSRTLLKLTGSTQRGWCLINDTHIFVRRMSNDDNARGLLTFLKNLKHQIKSFLIITLCPAFDDPQKQTNAILDLLCKSYKPYFFILKNRYLGSEHVTPLEIENLQKLGTVKVLEGKHDDKARAHEFFTFLRNHL